MPDTVLAVAHVLFLWWFGTGAVLFLDGLPRRTYPWTLAGAALVALAATAGLVASADDTGVGGAHLAFASALGIWGVNEILFLTGAVTGPRRTACPEGARGWSRFRYAAESVIYHELAVALSALVVWIAVAGGDNKVGLWTFLALWVMRLSTKINIFLGVRNLGEEFLPDHLRYLASYFRRAPMNPAFPVSMVGSTALLAFLVVSAAAPATSAVEGVGLTILATLVGLALLEHLFLVLPFDPATLWRWGFTSRAAAAAPAPFRPDAPAPLKAAVDRPRR